MNSLTDTLYIKYNAQIKELINIFLNPVNGGVKSIPKIITKITTQIVPLMMEDVGKIKRLSGDKKKRFIIETLNLSLSSAFDEINQLPELASENWDDKLRDLLVILIDQVIDKYIDIENKNVIFNKKGKNFILCK